MSDLPRCVVLGHHVEDQAESFLLNLLRGAGLSGLGSMRRLVSRPHLKLLRPLLPYTKSQCLSYIQSLGLSTVTDSSNFETLYARNYLRGRCMPPLASRWPNVYDRFEKSIRALQSDWDLLSSYALERLNAISKIQFGLLCIDRTRFNRLPDSERHLLFRVYLRQNSGIYLVGFRSILFSISYRRLVLVVTVFFLPINSLYGYTEMISIFIHWIFLGYSGRYALPINACSDANVFMPLIFVV